MLRRRTATRKQNRTADISDIFQSSPVFSASATNPDQRPPCPSQTAHARYDHACALALLAKPAPRMRSMAPKTAQVSFLSLSNTLFWGFFVAGRFCSYYPFCLG